MDPILDIAKRHGIRVVEDAAQAHGARYRDRICGTIGDLGTFSFYPGKNLGAYGDAGAVVGDSSLLARIRKLRDHGRTSKYEHDEVGSGERMDALQAAILAVKLRHLPEWTLARQQVAAWYERDLRDLDVTTPETDPLDVHVFHLYVIKAPSRDALLQHLQVRGVGAGIHYPIPLHRQPAFAALPATSLPATERVAAEIVSLPMYAELDREQVGQVVEAIRAFYR
jgi:dTDP-4-amino-4,6-dideoxygalactose transaminase